VWLVFQLCCFCSLLRFIFCSHFPDNRDWSRRRVWSRLLERNQRSSRVVQAASVAQQYTCIVWDPFPSEFSVKTIWNVTPPPVVYITSYSSPSQCLICDGLMCRSHSGISLCIEWCPFVKTTRLAIRLERTMQLVRKTAIELYFEPVPFTSHLHNL
jgi:hypothetical protein